VAFETGILTLIVLIFVNMIPKSHAAHNAERWVLASAGPVYILTVIFGPIATGLDHIASLFVNTKGMKNHVTEDEIRTMTRMGVKSGAVERGEKELIERVFLFNDITASDVLTPREIMFALEADRKLGDVLEEINNQRFSRYPVFEGTTDNIVGIVHIKDLLSRMIDHESMSKLKVRDCMTPPVFVNEKALIDDLFRELKRQRVHMAIVTNDNKTVVGLLTLEDLIEELVGEISDETDVDEFVIKRVDKHTIVVHGDKDIPDINRFFNTRIDEGDARTIGRLVRAKAGKIPKQGQPVLVANDVMAVVEHVSRGRILKVRLIKSVNGGTVA
jgi:putative hemolysin